jgi:uncharacterized membrane protein
MTVSEPTEVLVSTPGRPEEGLIAWTHVIYALHALAVLIGATSAATIVGAFVFGVPSIIAVILTYVKRSDAKGTFLESHFTWCLRTFWFAVIWGIGATVLTLILIATIVGILVAWLPILVLGIWVAYRVIRGWLALKDGKAMPLPG